MRNSMLARVSKLEDRYRARSTAKQVRDSSDAVVLCDDSSKVEDHRRDVELLEHNKNSIALWEPLGHGVGNQHSEDG